MPKRFEKVIGYLWLGLVALLPITSLPLLARAMHTSSVAPASLIFLVFLIFLWLPVYLKKGGDFPFPTQIAVIFLLVALISTALSFFYFFPSYKENRQLSAIFEGVVTLGIGFLFYLITVITPNSEPRLRKTLQVLNWSGAVMICWALFFQFVTNAAPGNIVTLLRNVQAHFTTSMLYVNRATGFASEPSWQAHILNMVYLPFWLSATMTRFTAHSHKVWRFSFENILLAAGVLTLFATFSRAGILAFFLVLAFLFIRFNIWVVRKVSQKWKANRLKLLINAFFIIAIVAVYMLLALGCLYGLSRLDPRMASVFSIDVAKQGGISKYFDMLEFGERVTYWQTGWRIFNESPVFGVGLGNAGFYFQNLLPDNAWQLTEVRKLLYSSPGLMNIKSMWLRVLAETGIVGFSVFLLFLIASGLVAGKLVKSPSGLKKVIGWMGIFMLISFIVEGFSVDSFALPYLWFTQGLVAATWRWAE